MQLQVDSVSPHEIVISRFTIWLNGASLVVMRAAGRPRLGVFTLRRATKQRRLEPRAVWRTAGGPRVGRNVSPSDNDDSETRKLYVASREVVQKE